MSKALRDIQRAPWESDDEDPRYKRADTDGRGLSPELACSGQRLVGDVGEARPSDHLNLLRLLAEAAEAQDGNHFGARLEFYRIFTPAHFLAAMEGHAPLLDAAKAVLAKLESPTGSVTILDQERLAAAVKASSERRRAVPYTY